LNIQLDFFEETDDISILKKQDSFLLDRVDNLRRGLFKRHDVHEKAINMLLTMLVKQDETIDCLKKDMEHLRNLLIKEVK
jgi:hypothetical protein